MLQHETSKCESGPTFKVDSCCGGIHVARLTYPRDRFGPVLSMIRIPLPEEQKRRKEKISYNGVLFSMSLASDARTRFRIYPPGEVVEIIAFEIHRCLGFLTILLCACCR